MIKYKIILFDGICVLCNSFIRFIADHDVKNQIKFVHLQSESGKILAEKFHIQHVQDLSAIVLIDNKEIYYKSSAILRVFTYFYGLWKTLYFLVIIPPLFRDMIYTAIAKRRYKWFGKYDKCVIPNNLQKKFDISELKL